jgi:signal transduction histidine kinase
MNAIQGFSSIMLSGMGVTLEPKARGMMERISSNSERMIGLINSILDMARLESGRAELKSQTLSPTKLASQWEAQISGLAEQKKLAFRTEVDAQLPPEILGDEEALSKIAINLLGNAFKFTEQGQVTLALKSQNQHWVIEVRDTGIGIPEQAQEYIFEEFRQVDGSTSRQYEGTGLGLAIVKKLTQAMKGNVSVKSEVGKGSTFRVELPLKVANVETLVLSKGSYE